MAQIRITIEPRWAYAPHTEVIDVDDSELEGLSTEERTKYLEQAASDYVNDECSWGWSEVNDDGE